MHQKRKDGNVKKLQENTKSMYALKSKYNVHRMIKSDPGSIESGKKLNQARPIKHNHHLKTHQQHHCKHLNVLWFE